jgi:hypothetical protein
MKLKAIAALSLLTLAHATAFASDEATNLIFHIGKDDRALIRSQILAAARAVGPRGKLIIGYAGPKNHVPKHLQDSQLDFELRELIQEFPADVRSQLITVSSNEAYQWVRDSAVGWQKKPDGHFTLHGARIGNKAFGKDTPGLYSALGISTALLACEQGSLELPTLGEVNAQGGMVVMNGEGTCIINSDIERWGKSARELLKGDLGCSEIVEGPAAMSWVQQKHFHGHIDLSALFIGPRVVLIPKLDPDCKSSFKTGWSELKKSLEQKGLKAVEVSVAGGCIEATKSATPIVASYSNAVVLKDSILLPEFEGENEAESLRYKRTNEEARKAIVDLMNAGEIPKKEVIGFPMPKSFVSGGGEVRCATFEVPARLGACTQTKLNRAIGRLITSAEGTLKDLKKGQDRKACERASDASTLLEFLKDEIERERTLTDVSGKHVALSERQGLRFKSTLKRLTAAAATSCQFK